MNEKDQRCGLIGGKLSHSYSPLIHSALGKKYEYRLIELSSEELCGFFTKKEFDAINVTIPYKKECMQYLDEISDEARGIGAVNTVVNRGGKLFGYNTDVYGISESFRRAGISVKGKKALVLGTGGASLAAIYFLKNSGADVINVSRSKKEGCITYGELSEHRDAKIIVNATPVGMFPNVDAAPIKLMGAFDSLEFVFDMIYNPFRTKLLLEAEKLGISCMNGLYMLTAQAAKAAEHFCGENVPEENVDRAFCEVLKSCISISLVGMPGSGKSTIGSEVAKRLSCTVCDTDEYFTKKNSLTPAEAITTLGEARFRELEEECVLWCVRQGGVVATGGGAVLREANREAMRMHGVVFLIERDLSALAVEGRPLSMGRSLTELYNERRKYYEEASDAHIENDKVENACEEIIRKLPSFYCFRGGKQI